jgi:hypothetical protein
MVSRKIGRLAVAALATAALLGGPRPAAAQSSTFIIDIVDQLFTNPCTNETVLVNGRTTVTVTQTLFNTKGEIKTAVSAVSKGTGVGQTFGFTYVYSENQNATFIVPLLAAGEIFESTFSDKFALKGDRSIDDWIIRAFFKIKVDAKGTILVSLDKMTGDICKG